VLKLKQSVKDQRQQRYWLVKWVPLYHRI
jgi:hypothetical protein